MHETATTPPPPAVDDVLHGLYALGVAVPEEAGVREYLHRHTDVLPVVRAAGERLRAHFGPRTSLSLELYRDPEFSTYTLTLYVREADYSDRLLPSLEAIADGLCDDFPHPYGYLLVTTDFTPPKDA